MAPVKVEHSSIAHRCLCCSFRQATTQSFSSRTCLNTSIQTKLASWEPECVRHLVVLHGSWQMEMKSTREFNFNSSIDLHEDHKWAHFQWDLTWRYWTSMAPPSVRSYLRYPTSITITPIVPGKKSLDELWLKTYLTILCAPFKSLTQMLFIGNQLCKFWPWATNVEQQISLTFNVAGGRDGKTICSAFPWG